MKITIKNANSPFAGSVIEICNLVAGCERFRLVEYPLLGKYLWDGEKTIEVEKPFDGEKFLFETGLDICFNWFEAGNGSPKVLGKIFIGSKWTGPLFYIHSNRGGEGLGNSETVRFSPCFSNGNYGKSFSNGGTWRGILSLNDTYREATTEELEHGLGHNVRTDAADGFKTMRECFDYRFNRNRLAEFDRNRLFVESSEMVSHIEVTLKNLGLL